MQDMRSGIGARPRCKARKIALLEQRLEILVERLSNGIAQKRGLEFVACERTRWAQQQRL